jgi:uncharacterized protein DUF995
MTSTAHECKSVLRTIDKSTNSLGKIRLTFVLVCLMSVPASRSASAEDQIASDAAKGRPLTAKELNAIYQDKTLPWDNGAGYFATAKRVFTAWYGNENKPTYAEGSWSVNDQGQLCYSALWHTVEGQGPAKTCYEHRSSDREIYARKLPEGKWYLFSHLPAQPEDEIEKLQPGDHASEGYQKNKHYIAEQKEQIASEATKGRPLTGKEINSIYQDKTLPWEDGAAFFGAKRTFMAWYGKGQKATYAEGSWSANDQGRLCYTASWHTLKGQGPSTTCVEHRNNNNRIYARKLPDGKWYMFSHLPAHPEDAVQKLQSGNHVSEDYHKNANYLTAHSHARKKR